MTVDTEMIAEVSMGIMDSIRDKFGDEPEGIEIIAAGMVVVVRDEKAEMTYTRTYSTEKIYYRALGLFQAALDTVTDGDPPSQEDEEEDDD